MATEALAEPQRGRLGRLVEFLREVRAEVKKVTWPTVEDLRRFTIVIVIFVSVLGLVIGLMDSVLQLVFVSGVASLFR